MPFGLLMRAGRGLFVGEEPVCVPVGLWRIGVVLRGVRVATVVAAAGVFRGFVGWPAERFELFDAFDGERGDALALGLEALDANETFGVDVERVAESLGAAIGDAQAGVGLVGEQDEARGRIVADEARVAGARRAFEGEALDVGVALLVGVEEDGGPDRVRREFLDAQDVGLKVVVDVESGGVERAALQDDKHKVAAMKLAQRLAAAVVVEAMDVVVEPHLSPAERRLSVRFERNLVHLIAGEEIAT